LGLLALFLSIFSNVLLASVADCDDQLKHSDDYNSLYGLCVAYWNANEGTAQDKILENYNKKALNLGGPSMPGLSECPCWGADELIDATCNVTLGEVNAEGEDPYRALSLDLRVQFAAFGSICGYTDTRNDPAVVRIISTNAEEDLTCRAGIVALVNDDFLSECPYP
jgi:hypothetical protein